LKDFIDSYARYDEVRERNTRGRERRREGGPNGGRERGEGASQRDI